MTEGTVAFAFVLGMVALFNPCGFPLLPVYLAAFVGGERTGAAARIGAGVRAGLALTVGFLTVFSIAAVLAGSVHTIVLALAPWLMIVIAIAITILGVMAAAGRSPALHAAPGFRDGTGFVPMAGFGVAYAVGSLSCSLPVFIAAISGALATGSGIVTVAVVLAYGLGMGLLATVLALIVSVTGSVVTAPLRRAAAALPRIAGAACIVIGLYLLGYWAGQAFGVDLVAPVTAVLDGVQAAVVAAIENAWLPIGVVLALTVLVMLVAAARQAGTTGVPASPHRRHREET